MRLSSRGVDPPVPHRGSQPPRPPPIFVVPSLSQGRFQVHSQKRAQSSALRKSDAKRAAARTEDAGQVTAAQPAVRSGCEEDHVASSRPSA